MKKKIKLAIHLLHSDDLLGRLELHKINHQIVLKGGETKEREMAHLEKRIACNVQQ